MERKICLDTDAIIAILKNEKRAPNLIDKIKDSETFITTVNLFELLLRERNLDQIEVFREKINLFDFNELASRKASEISKDLKKKGKTVEFRDVFIASICIVNDCTLATFNLKDFENIKDLKLIDL